MGHFHTLKGSCHCGNVRYDYDSPVPSADINIRRCDCTFCQKQGAFYTSHPDGRLRVTVKDQGMIRKYRFASLTSETWVCTKCGVFPFFTCDLEGRLYAVLNVNTLDDFQFNRMTVPTLSLGDDPVEKRLARRVRAWIGDVRIEFEN